MGEKERDVGDVSTNDPTGHALLAASTISSAVPVLGGVISNLVNGYASQRQQKRVAEVLIGLGRRLSEIQAEVDQQYVASEEFEDLLHQTMRRVADERNEEKRQMYRDFLVDEATSPGSSYDEQLRFLRTLEELQGDHLMVLKALMAEPDPRAAGGITGSQIQTLKKRLLDMEETRIKDLVDQLNNMGLTKMTSLNTMMTAHGAQQLSHAVTQYGHRFIRFL